MTDQDQTDNADSSEEPLADSASAEAPTGGARLAAARRDQKISVQEIAAELHIDEPKVRALESNEFELLGAAVFAKGHLRKYAQLVGVDEANIEADYERLTDANEAPQFVAIGTKSQREFSPLPWLILVIFLVAAGVAYWWLSKGGPISSESSDSASIESPSEATESIAAGALEIDDDLEEATPINAESKVTAQEQSLELPVPTAENDSAAVIATAPTQTDEIRIGLEFAGDCWTEITDANGRRLFFDLGSAGRTIDVTGKAPLNVLFGNASNVSLSVNGESRAIDNIDRRGTARMTLVLP